MDLASNEPPPSLGAEARALGKLALPLMVAQGGQMLMGVVDTIVVGRTTPVDMAAVTLANGVIGTIGVFVIAAGTGIEPYVGQAFGAGEHLRARSWLWQGAHLGWVLSLPLALLTVLATFLFVPSGLSPELSKTASLYVLGRLPSFASFGLMIALKSYLACTNRSFPILLSVGVANVVNLVLDLALVLGWFGLPRLGALGAAIATSISSWLIVLILGLAIAQRPLAPADSAQLGRAPDRMMMARIFRLGWPIGSQASVEVGIFMLVAWLIGRMGEVELSGHSIALNLASLTFMTALGISNAATARVAYHIGAERPGEARRAGLLAIAAGAGFMSLTGALFLLAPGPLAALFTPDPAVRALGRPLVMIAGAFALWDGVQAVSNGALRGAGDTAWAFYANVAAHWVIGLPVGLVLAHHFELGARGYWWGLTAGLAGVAITLFFRFLSLSKGPLRRLEGPAPGPT
ncbi:MAG: MATE family efflux transporter [Deltaproteobacteria bacterium]|nr:MATE family efflux transporter [Deltaproteobacteria bacterium]